MINSTLIKQTYYAILEQIDIKKIRYLTTRINICIINYYNEPGV